MAIQFLKRSTLPEAVKGKVGTQSISITENGQIMLSTLSTKLLGGVRKVALAFDKGKVFLFFPDAPIVKKADMEDKDFVVLKDSKKGGQVYFGGAALLRDAKTFGDHIYNFSDSGNQTFALVMDEKNKALTFDLPKGAIAKRPVTARKKKAKAPAGVKAEVGSTQVLDEEPELVLESA